MFGILNKSNDSVKKKLYLNNVLLIVFIVILIEMMFLFTVKSYYLDMAKNNLENKVKIDSEYYNSNIFRNRDLKEKSRYILQKISLDKKIYAQVIDKDKNLVIDSNGNNNNLYFAAEDIDFSLIGKIKASTIKISENKDIVMAISAPLYSGDNREIIACLRYNISIKNLVKTINKISLVSLAIGFLIILGSFILSSILAKQIIEPIEELTAFSEKRARGDFTGQAKVVGNDEIGKLASTFNYMSQEIIKNENMKNEFIASISHELRTPLTAIKGWSETLLLGDLTEEETKEGLNIINNETERLKSLVEELLDFSKLDAGNMSLNKENINLVGLVKDVLDEFKPKFKDKNIKLEFKIIQDNLTVLGDYNRLKQVLVNIISNSLKFTNVYGKIKIVLFAKERYNVIEIYDNGIGISEKDLKYVTNKFYKANSKHPGSGIGLAVCQNILDLHQGNLIIESNENEGTLVRIELPGNF